MARSPKQQVIDEPELIADPVTETLTYVPGPNDPVQVVWGGHTFKANVPKEITGHATGTEREKLNATIIDSARRNRHFVVGSGRPKRDPARDPTTPEEYRGYFAEWLKQPGFDHAEDLIARFAKDRDLQTACGVGTDDYDFMRDLFMPKLHELSKVDEMNDNQLASVWMRHGYMTTPW
jgi:hypothetical protein